MLLIAFVEEPNALVESLAHASLHVSLFVGIGVFLGYTIEHSLVLRGFGRYSLHLGKILLLFIRKVQLTQQLARETGLLILVAHGATSSIAKNIICVAGVDHCWCLRNRVVRLDHIAFDGQFYHLVLQTRSRTQLYLLCTLLLLELLLQSPTR